jgi:hypothetical protein
MFLRSVRPLLVTANDVPGSPILVSLIMEVLCSSEKSQKMTFLIVTAVKTSNLTQH